MLTQLLRHGSVSYQGGFCNLTNGQLVPLPIRAASPEVKLRRDLKDGTAAQPPQAYDPP